MALPPVNSTKNEAVYSCIWIALVSWMPKSNRASQESKAIWNRSIYQQLRQIESIMDASRKIAISQDCGTKENLVRKLIFSDKKLASARLVVFMSPEGIDASCSDALSVFVDGIVRTVQQKRNLESICNRYSDETVSIYGSHVGIKPKM